MSTIEEGFEHVADCLGIAITVNNGVLLRKEVSRSAKLNDKVNLSMYLTPVAVFANEQVGVLVKACGALHILSAYYPKTGKLSVFLIDAAKGKKYISDLRGIIDTQDTLRDAIDALGDSVCSAYHLEKGKWEKLQLNTGG